MFFFTKNISIWGVIFLIMVIFYILFPKNCQSYQFSPSYDIVSGVENGFSIGSEDLPFQGPVLVTAFNDMGNGLMELTIGVQYPYVFDACRVNLVNPENQLIATAKQVSYKKVVGLNQANIFETQNVIIDSWISFQDTSIEVLSMAAENLFYELAPVAAACGGAFFFQPLIPVCAWTVNNQILASFAGQAIQASVANYHDISYKNDVANYLETNNFHLAKIKLSETYGHDIVEHKIILQLSEDISQTQIIVDADFHLSELYAQNYFGTRQYHNTATVLKVINTPLNYSINSSAGTNGTISPIGQISIEQGKNKTFNAKPNTGYEVDQWYVNGRNVPGSEGEESITLNITGDTYVLVTFKSIDSGSQVYVGGSLNPSSISCSLAAGGSGKFFDIPVQNKGSSTITVKANLTGDAAGWASMTNTNSSFTLVPKKNKKSRVTVFAPENVSSGTYTLTVSFNGTVQTFLIHVTVTGEDYEEVIDEGPAEIGGPNWKVENVDIPRNVWGDIDDGFYDNIRLYAHVDSVSTGGILRLYDANFNYLMSTTGKGVTSKSVGRDIYWNIAKYRLDKNDNTFGIAAPAGTNLQLSNFRLVITFYTEGADIKLTKSLSSSTAAVGENITVTVTAENFAENSTTGFDVELTDSLPLGISLVSGSLNDNDFGDLEEEEARANTYTIVANQPGHYTLPSARLEYESINGDDLADESIPVELLVTAGPLLVGAQIIPPIDSQGNVGFIATVSDPVTNQSIQNAAVQGVLQKQNGNNWETIQISPLGWSTADNAFVGVSPEIATAGNYLAYVISQKDLYAEGQSVSVGFTITSVSVPDIIGLSQANAGLTITSADLTVGKITSEYSSTVPAGSVISQNPVSGSSVVKKSEVDIVISIGALPAPQLSATPDSRTVDTESGTTTFSLNTIGTGPLSWQASVTSGASWLSIQSGSTGTNSGTIKVSFSENTSNSNRTGIIRITSSKSGSEPIDISITQLSSATNDTDQDGLLDLWEKKHFNDLATADGTTDTDGDGLLDIDEQIYQTDPNNTDTDLDGDSDGDEVAHGTDPTIITDTIQNHKPSAPQILLITGDVTLKDPLFDADAFNDPDESQGDYLLASEWQISTDQTFQGNIVFHQILKKQANETDESKHRKLQLPQGILVENTKYWIRTRHCDQKNLWSPWSESKEFNTETQNSIDQDGNGIDDNLQVTGFIDVNNNGIDDIQENILTLYDAEEGSEVGMQSNSGTICNLSSIATEDIPDELLPDKPMPCGMFSFRIEDLPVDEDNPSTADITIYFPNQLPSDTKWYKYDKSKNTITDFTSYTAIVDNYVILTLTDGGEGDSDGVVNGIIIDPSGAAFSESGDGVSSGSSDSSDDTTDGGSSANSGDSGSGSGDNSGGDDGGSSSTSCFIATAAFGSYMEPHVVILRQFRDTYLLSNKTGRYFVNAYYRYSPPVADFIAGCDSLKVLVRIGLAPVVAGSWVALNYGVLPALCILVCFLVSVAWFFRQVVVRRPRCSNI